MLKNILLSTVAVASLSLSYVHAGKPGEELVSSGSSFSRKRLHTDDGASSSDQSSNTLTSQAVDHEGYTAYLASLDYLTSLAPDDEIHEFDFAQSPVVVGYEEADSDSPNHFDEDYGFNNNGFSDPIYDGHEREYVETLTPVIFDNHEFDYTGSIDPVVEGYEEADLDSPTPVDYLESLDPVVETEENNYLAYLKSLDSEFKPEEDSDLAYLESLDPEIERFYYYDRYNSDYGPPVELDNFSELSRMHRRRIDSYQYLGGSSSNQ